MLYLKNGELLGKHYPLRDIAFFSSQLAHALKNKYLSVLKLE
nr:MAG TPA: hypothetical protein [Caudoviricetes sp.]